MYLPGDYMIAGDGNDAPHQLSQLEGNTARATNWHSAANLEIKELGAFPANSAGPLMGHRPDAIQFATPVTDKNYL